MSWENKIIEAFVNHYFAGHEHKLLRLRSSLIFPDFNTARPDEKESYLEAAESLERKGLVRLGWEKRGKGEHLKTLSCENFEELFNEAGRPFPKYEAEEIKSMLDSKAKSAGAEELIPLLEYLSLNFSPREIGQGINKRTMEDLIRLLEFFCDSSQREGLTTRALSILLYKDSKLLENLLALCKPLLLQAGKTVPVPDISFLERSYPETYIAGKIIINYKNEKIPLINTGGHILGIPLENAEKIESIEPISGSNVKTVLTIENKETFFALATPQKQRVSKKLSSKKLLHDCFLYAGGYSNRAVVTLIKILAASNFSFYHTGDLDPDGILILQHIQDMAGKPVTPVRMDAGTFDQYRTWARALTKPMLRQIGKIRDETRAVPELTGLLQRIEQTGLGVEQEIVDYR